MKIGELYKAARIMMELKIGPKECAVLCILAEMDGEAQARDVGKAGIVACPSSTLVMLGKKGLAKSKANSRGWHTYEATETFRREVKP
jgi:hypothetical protein